MGLRIMLAALAAAFVIAAPATAAEPESGEVSAAKPTVKWTGSVTDPTGAYDLASWFAGEMGPTCQTPHCDVFTLKVAPGAVALTIKMTGGDGAENVAFEVENPSGDAVYVDSEDTEYVTERERTFDEPAEGEWTIRLAGSGAFDYEASATLAVAGAQQPAPSGGGGETPKPAGQPSPQPQPQPAPQQQQQQQQPPASGSAPSTTPPAPALTVRALTAKARSAKRLRKGRRVALSLQTTGPLSNVTAILVPAKKRTQVLGSGRIKSLARKGSVKLKLAKAVKRGKYVIVVSGLDSQGRRVVAQRAVTVRR